MLARNHLEKIIILIASVLLLGVAQAVEEQITIYMIGDSTMADKPLEDNPERGWGQLLPVFVDGAVRIENHAKNGRSTRSFLAESLWQLVVAKLKPGDYVIIQFGHNDEKPEKIDRYTPPEDYRKNLLKFVGETRAKEATPILCTPIVRRRFDSTGTFYDEHGVYPDIVREVAKVYDVPLLDMHKKSEALLRELGPEESKKIFLWIDSTTYKSLPHGKIDNTHFSEYGATTMAAFAVEEIQRLSIPLAHYLKAPEHK
ncbi:MAG: rhamnogalacturonan acetylesterase [Bacteroidetes bacterium]|nr:MAG: rhamnogalacturonan acetylesterase [Bacteroidota bacterium]